MRNWPFSSKTSFVRVGNTTSYWTASSFGSVPVSMPTDQGSSWRTHLVAMMTYVKWNNNQSWPVMASSTTLQVLWSASVVPSSNHRQRLNIPNHRLISLSLILSSRRRLSAFFQVSLWLKQAHDALRFVMLLVGNNGQSRFAIRTFYWRIAVRMHQLRLVLMRLISEVTNYRYRLITRCYPASGHFGHPPDNCSDDDLEISNISRNSRIRVDPGYSSLLTIVRFLSLISHLATRLTRKWKITN